MALSDATLGQIETILLSLQPVDAIHAAMTMLITSAKRAGVPSGLLRSAMTEAIDIAIKKDLIREG